MDVHAPHVTDRLTHLRATLLMGRGTGAPPSEVADHTRHRPELQLVPASVGRLGWGSAAATGSGPHLALVETPRPSRGGRVELDTRSALVGALATAVAWSVGARALRAGRTARDVPTRSKGR